MAEEAIIRVVIEEGARGGFYAGAPPEPSGGIGGAKFGGSSFDTAPITTALATLRTALVGITSDIMRASESMRQIPYMRQSAPKALPNYSQSQIIQGNTPYQQLKSLYEQRRSTGVNLSEFSNPNTALESVHAEMNETRDNFNAIMQGAGLTDKEMRAIYAMFTDVASISELGTSHQKQVRRSALEKLGAPTDLLRKLKAEHADDFRRERKKRGEKIEGLKEKAKATQAGGIPIQVYRDIEDELSGLGGHMTAEEWAKQQGIHLAEGGMLNWFSSEASTFGFGDEYIDETGHFHILKGSDGKYGVYNWDPDNDAVEEVPIPLSEHKSVELAKKAAEWHVKKKLAEMGGEMDYRPNEVMPEDHYAKGGMAEGGEWEKFSTRRHKDRSMSKPFGVSSESAYINQLSLGRKYDPIEGIKALGLYIRPELETLGQFNLWQNRKLLASADSVEALKDIAIELAAKRFDEKVGRGFDWRPDEVMPEDHYAAGGRVNMTRGGSMPNTGMAASGSDWHPAWLTDREFVMNQKSTAANLGALVAANADPNVRLRAEHYATGGGRKFGTNFVHEFFDQLGLTNAVGPQGPQQPAVDPQTVESLANMAGIAFGAPGQAIMAAVYMVGKAEDAFQEKLVSATASVGEFARALADPDADPSKLFSGAGEKITSGGESLSKLINSSLAPIGAALGLDLVPQLKAFTGVTGEAAKQFGALMQAVDATSKRYGEYSPAIAVADAMVEVQHTMGELRRAQEAGPELARYLRAQGDLQQKAEDIKIKLLSKLLPLVTLIVTAAERTMPIGEGIAEAIGALLSPITATAGFLNRIAGAAEDANRPDVRDPTSLIFEQAGVLQGQGGIRVPQE